jgi:hypothetical protein
MRPADFRDASKELKTIVGHESPRNPLKSLNSRMEMAPSRRGFAAAKWRQSARF